MAKKSKGKAEGIGGESGGNIFYREESMYDGGPKALHSPHGSNFHPVLNEIDENIMEKRLVGPGTKGVKE